MISPHPLHRTFTPLDPTLETTLSIVVQDAARLQDGPGYSGRRVEDESFLRVRTLNPVEEVWTKHAQATLKRVSELSRLNEEAIYDLSHSLLNHPDIKESGAGGNGDRYQFEELRRLALCEILRVVQGVAKEESRKLQAYWDHLHGISPADVQIAEYDFDALEEMLAPYEDMYRYAYLNLVKLRCSFGVGEAEECVDVQVVHQFERRLERWSEHAVDAIVNDTTAFPIGFVRRLDREHNVLLKSWERHAQSCYRRGNNVGASGLQARVRPLEEKYEIYTKIREYHDSHGGAVSSVFREMSNAWRLHFAVKIGEPALRKIYYEMKSIENDPDWSDTLNDLIDSSD